jgi:hypothetical protein
MHLPTCAPIATVILCLFVAPAFGGGRAPSASPRSAESSIARAAATVTAGMSALSSSAGTWPWRTCVNASAPE